jgi:hypothetical protein
MLIMGTITQGGCHSVLASGGLSAVWGSPRSFERFLPRHDAPEWGANRHETGSSTHAGNVETIVSPDANAEGECC